MKNTEECYERPWLRLKSGPWFFDEPTFDIRDIALALPKICRFGGHINRFYSVASHSIIVSQIMSDFALGDPFEGLLHDGTEAYLGDMLSPLKSQFPDWGAHDARLELALRTHFGLPLQKTEGCKQADWTSVFMEAYWYLDGQGEDFMDPYGLRPWAIKLAETKYRHHYTDPPDIKTAGMAFTGVYNQLSHARQ